MNSKPDLKALSAEERAQELVSYLDEKFTLINDLQENLRPQSFKNEIETVFKTAENALKDIKGQR